MKSASKQIEIDWSWFKNKKDIIPYLKLAGIEKLNRTESLADALKFVQGIIKKRVGSKEINNELPGFYIVKKRFVRIKSKEGLIE